MDILVNVVNQRLKVSTNQKTFVAGTQEFIRFVFELSDDWSSLTTFAQFQQNGHSYNVYLDSNNSVYLPTEIVSGDCTLALQGNRSRIIAKSAPLVFSVEKDPVISDASGTDITLTLYDQMAGLLGEIDDRVDTLETRMTALEENEVIAEEIHSTVEATLQDYLENGYFAAMTIGDGSIARIKIDSSFEQDLQAIEDALETAMQPSMYDPRGYEQDIFAYAKARADEVNTYLESYKTSNNTQIGNIWTHIRDAYIVDGITYNSLAAAINGAVSSAEAYCRALLAEYEAFTVEIVDELPVVGVANTFYLLPNNSGTGYDKYWWIEDGNGNSMWDVFGSSSTLVVTQLPQVGEEDVDYILKSNDSCLYYKYIDNTWRLIAGSLAFVGNTLPVTGDSLTDYYILQNGVYLHYRWINNTYELIGSDAYSKSQTDSLLNAIRSQLNTNTENIGTNATNISSLSHTLTNLQQTVSDLDTEGVTYYATYGNAEINGEVKEHVFTLYEVDDGEETIKSQFIIAGGGGGGQQAATTLVVERITSSPLIVTPTDNVILQFTYSSLDSDNQEVDGTYTWKLGSTVIATGSCIHGTNTLDATEFCSIGTQKFTLTVTDEGGSTVVKTWTVQKVDIRLESTFNDRIAYAPNATVNFTYTPYGAVAKTVHFILDGVELQSVSTSASGTLQSYSISPQSHGSHLLECYVTATINSSPIETEHIYRDIIWYDETAETPVISCIYRYDYYGNVTARQYDTTAIVYNVFDPSTNYPTIKRYVDNVLVGTDIAQTTLNTWNFKSDDVGLHTLKIEVGETYVIIKVNVTELGIDVSPITGNLEIDFNPTGITNNSADRIWSNENYHMTVSQNFDWANGGYKMDENGDTYFLIKAGTRATFDYEMFAGGINGNPSVIGAEMKIIFMTERVQDPDAVWLTNAETTTTEVDGVTQTTNVGIQMGVHEGWLKTNNASDTDVEGEGSESIAATNTYLYMPYSEEDIIEMDINIDILDTEDNTAKAFVMAYEDGVPSKAYVYDSGDRFYQYSPKPLVIGSDYCDVRIYRLKIYSTALSTENIMRNFIADSRDSTTMLARYDRNSIYYNTETGKYTPYSGEGVLDPERLAPIIPNVKVLMLETDHFTTSKKTFVKSKLRCIHSMGGNVYPGDPYYDNWLFENGYHAGQGTTSDNYGNAGRNVDFLFNCDGTHKPSDKVEAEAGYISQVTRGYGTDQVARNPEQVTDWKGNAGKIDLTRTSVPNNFFNLKVNIASSENVNNALLQKRYNDFLPYISPAKLADSKVKNDMEFVPAVLFLKESNPDISTHNEFLDTNWHFYALGNIGDSKKTDYTRAYDKTDMNEFTIEISDNTKNNSTFQTGIEDLGNGEYRMETFKLVKTLNTKNELVVTPVAYTPVLNHIQHIPASIVADYWDAVGTITVENNTGDPQYDGNETGYLNMRRWCLENEDFDGDHSFEPRYACCGDYRDGKLVNDTSGRGKAQVKINNAVWRAFYRWVVTSTDSEFANDLDQWCVRSAVEFFYAFTHMYTMMDNRAKNTFWHFAKTGTYREVSKPYQELLHIYCEKDGDDYIPTEDVTINNGKTYYTQYAFDLWDYDNDTAIGINNNGELVFPYGKEDTDYNIDNTPSSGFVYNGADSAFWCRLRDLLPNEIENTFKNATSTCFSAENLIKQFDDFQECYPEEIWRLDIERKYIRTFTGKSIDNSKPKLEVQFLRDMMQGRKKYQRRQWVRDQEIYFGTKHLMNIAISDENKITFRCYNPGASVAVPADYTIKITPYSDMYVSAMFGNGDTRQIRAKGGEMVEMQFNVSTATDTQVVIYGANRIQALNDLSACYITAPAFSAAKKLKKLVLGNTTTGYNNARLTSLDLGDNSLLEELDVRNCNNLTGALNLAQCSNLLKLYAEGTNITGVTFATNGKLQIAHLPSSINTLTMRNLNNLTDFQATLSRLENLTLQGGTLDSLDVVGDCISTLQTLYLYDIDWTVADTTLLNSMADLFYSLVTGSVYVSGQIRQQELNRYATVWSDLEVTYNSANLVTQYLATYVNADGTTLYTCYVDRGSTPPDPVTLGLIPAPTRASTEQYTFTYNGWDDITSAMLAARTITASYTSTVRTYTVTWYSRAGLSLGSVTANYGDDVTYSGDIPTNTSEEGAYVYNVFAGWDKSTGFIRGDTDVYAIWKRAELPAAGTDLKDMTEAEIYAVVSSGQDVSNYFEQKDYYDITLGHDFDFSNVESTTFVGKNGTISTSELYLDGATAYNTGIKLFGENEESFTLAIDFRFSSTTVNNTLLACFEEDGSEGFRLRYNSNANIQWGNMNHSFGNGKFRDIVVLRHKKGEAKLYIYASNASGSTSFSDAITRIESTRNRVTNTESTISLGAIRFLGNGGYDDYGTGMIYWCKLWHDDLGDENARQLASWYHEKLRIEYRGTNLYRLAGNTSQRAGASFIANNLLGDRVHYMNSTNTNSGGWDNCMMRKNFMPRLYNALPTVWKSMIKKVKVNASAGSQSSEILISEDYVYLPAVKEVDNGQTSTVYVSEGSFISWFTSNIRRAKFRGVIIPDTATYYTTSSDPNTIDGSNVSIGDVWQPNGGTNTNYVFVSNQEIARCGYTVYGTATDVGGWVSAYHWWLRSPYVSSSTYFWIVNSSGGTYNSYAYYTYGVCPCFSI